MTEYESAYMDGYKAGMKFSNEYTGNFISKRLAERLKVYDVDYPTNGNIIENILKAIDMYVELSGDERYSDGESCGADNITYGSY